MLAYDMAKYYIKLIIKQLDIINLYSIQKCHWNKGGFKCKTLHSVAFSFIMEKDLIDQWIIIMTLIKLLSIHNYSNYKPVKITLENMVINIPDVVDKLNVSSHPIQGILVIYLP